MNEFIYLLEFKCRVAIQEYSLKQYETFLQK